MNRFLAVVDWLMLAGAALAAVALLMVAVGCGESPTPSRQDSTQERGPAPDQVERPKTVNDARTLAADADGQAAYWKALADAYRTQADALRAAEQQAQLERVCTWVRWLALLGLFGSTVLHVIAWIQPALRPLRALSGMGAAGAVAVLALAWVLPTWSPWLFWIAIALTVAGVGLLLYRLIRTGRGLEGAVRVAEKLKELAHPDLSAPARRLAQRDAAGTHADAINEVLPAIVPRKAKTPKKP